MQDWLVPLAQIMGSLEETPEGKRYHYPIRHGSMRVGVYAPKATARPAIAARPGRALHRDLGPRHVREGWRAARVRPRGRDLRRGRRHAPLRGVRRRLRHLGGVLGAARAASRREAGTAAHAGQRHNAALALVAGRAHPLSRRADPDHRQAGGRARARVARAAESISSTISTRCASGCRSRLGWPIAWTATPAAASCSAGIARRWPAWAGCSQNGQVEKVYWTVVRGRPPESAGTVEIALTQALRGSRLVDGGRSGRAGGDHRLPRPGRE